MPYTDSTEMSLIWGGTTVGDAHDPGYLGSPYNYRGLMTYLGAMASYGYNYKFGILHTNHASYSGDLAPSNPAGTTLRVASGAAINLLMIYTNDANVDFDCSATGYYHVVLRASTVDQTVRLAMLGPSSRGYPKENHAPRMNEISIALVYSNGATLSITDNRRFYRNLVLKNHSGEQYYWYISNVTKMVSGAMLECGLIEQEQLNMGNDSSYDYPRHYPNGMSPLTFFQAIGVVNSPGATKLFAQGNDGTNISYYLDSVYNLSGIMWLSIGPYR